jgi:hypothetical protein
MVRHGGLIGQGRKLLVDRAKGLKLPPVALFYHEAWGWTMQDGNHRFEALVNGGAVTYDASFGKPKRKQPFGSF